jgi:hypothetical protein
MKLSWHASFAPPAYSKTSPIPYKKKKRSSVRKVAKCKDEYINSIVWNVTWNISSCNVISLYIYIYICVYIVRRCSFYFLNIFLLSLLVVYKFNICPTFCKCIWCLGYICEFAWQKSVQFTFLWKRTSTSITTNDKVNPYQFDKINPKVKFGTQFFGLITICCVIFKTYKMFLLPLIVKTIRILYILIMKDTINNISIGITL